MKIFSDSAFIGAHGLIPTMCFTEVGRGPADTFAAERRKKMTPSEFLTVSAQILLACSAVFVASYAMSKACDLLFSVAKRIPRAPATVSALVKHLHRNDRIVVTKNGDTFSTFVSSDCEYHELVAIVAAFYIQNDPDDVDAAIKAGRDLAHEKMEEAK
jgi:hypothetical protein